MSLLPSFAATASSVTHLTEIPAKPFFYLYGFVNFVDGGGLLHTQRLCFSSLFQSILKHTPACLYFYSI
jgi:hypothetical protein